MSSLSARQESGGDERLRRILERTKDYCLKLEKAALDFTCMEKIEEKMYSLPEIRPDTTEEAYLLKNGKKFVRSLTTILYKDYRFFTVELEVNY